MHLTRIYIYTYCHRSCTHCILFQQNKWAHECAAVDWFKIKFSWVRTFVHCVFKVIMQFEWTKLKNYREIKVEYKIVIYCRATCVYIIIAEYEMYRNKGGDREVLDIGIFMHEESGNKSKLCYFFLHFIVLFFSIFVFVLENIFISNWMEYIQINSTFSAQNMQILY